MLLVGVDEVKLLAAGGLENGDGEGFDDGDEGGGGGASVSV